MLCRSQVGMYTAVTGEYDVRCGVLLSWDFGILFDQVDTLEGSQTICPDQPQYSGEYTVHCVTVSEIA